MCFFPTPNLRFDGDAYKRGVTHFECGACPECLKKRASRIMLRDVYEARDHVDNCMLTLTYDNYLRDDKGRVIGEQVADRSVDRRDIQLFIKRLRIYVWRHYGVRVKYRVSAEYGKRTHRPHYHVLIFGFSFPDAVFYKKSKRGSVIRRSALLNKLWRHGICTVDSNRVTPAIARYCSKYTQKDHGAEDTFSLCSHGIGRDGLYRDFNGIGYTIDGVTYPVPRDIWERYIVDCYSGGPIDFDNRYVNKTDDSLADGSYARSVRLRAAYRFVRDSDPLYKNYLAYWKRQGEIRSILQPSLRERIVALPDEKYAFYKHRALKCLMLRSRGIPAVAPRSNCRSYYNRWFFRRFRCLPEDLPLRSCLVTANDTLSKAQAYAIFGRGRIRPDSGTPFPPDPEKIQENFLNLLDIVDL